MIDPRSTLAPDEYKRGSQCNSKPNVFLFTLLVKTHTYMNTNLYGQALGFGTREEEEDDDDDNLRSWERKKETWERKKET